MRSYRLAVKMLAFGLLCQCGAVGGTPTARGQAMIAWDDATSQSYADGWQAGDDGGFGFEPWEFSHFFQAEFSAYDESQFIATNAHVDIPAAGPAFGLTNANRPFWGYTAWTTRPLSSPLLSGQTFSIDVDNPLLVPLAEFDYPGIFIQMRDDENREMLTLLAESGYNDDGWTLFDAGAGGRLLGLSTAETADGGMHLELQIVSPGMFELIATPLAGGNEVVLSGGFKHPDSRVHSVSIVMYSNGSAADGSREFYFNHLQVTGPLPGDANLDGVVDGIDFNRWNAHRGKLNATWADGDFNDDQRVDGLDFVIWNEHRFQSVGEAAVLPEPTSPVAWWLMAAAATLRHRRRSGRGNRELHAAQ
ncbi:MAG: hypothetical protein KDA60_08940 [Planctomycetales bacterium]|nr:hypothetical protein [Planctomycetales bacterium]